MAKQRLVEESGEKRSGKFVRLLKKLHSPERKTRPMVVMALSLVVGLGIGLFLKFLGLPVPVPHEFAGIVGLIGMFAGAEIMALILKSLGV
jgi:XapX domain-containing protein